MAFKSVGEIRSSEENRSSGPKASDQPRNSDRVSSSEATGAEASKRVFGMDEGTDSSGDILKGWKVNGRLSILHPE